MGVFKNTAKDVGRAVDRNLIKNFNPILGGLDSLEGMFTSTVFGGISGIGRALIGANPSFKTKNILSAPIHGLTYGVTRGAVALAKPVIMATAAAAATLTKNTPADLLRRIDNAGKFGRGVLGVGFKKAKGGPNDPTSFMGYKARAFTPMAITGGAALYGSMNAVKDYKKELATRSLVNGIMDTEGVHTAPGTVNKTYAPMSPGVRDFNTSGLGFALHKNRRG